MHQKWYNSICNSVGPRWGGIISHLIWIYTVASLYTVFEFSMIQLGQNDFLILQLYFFFVCFLGAFRVLWHFVMNNVEL